jgi:hypothetical protein
MTRNDDHLRDPDLGPVIDRLHAERPTASALELDAVKQRVLMRVARNPVKGSRRTEFMRSRLAILGMLVAGIVLSTGGAGLAVSGLANSQKAAISQYGPTVVTPTPTPSTAPPPGGGGVLGEEESSGSMPEESSTPTTNRHSAAPVPKLQPTRQVEAGAQSSPSASNELPFTGFAAIPILLGGVALLSAGLILRRRTRTDN